METNPNVHVSLIIPDKFGSAFACQYHKMKTENHWRFGGGKVEPGESLLQAAARECKEEWGIEPLELEYYTSTTRQIDGKIWTGHWFVVRRYTGELRAMEPEKHEGPYWLSAYQLMTTHFAVPEATIAAYYISGGQPQPFPWQPELVYLGLAEPLAPYNDSETLVN